MGGRDRDDDVWRRAFDRGEPGGEGAELVRRELVVHHTRAEVTEEQAAHIQDAFRVISDDERRTAQICGDVHAACMSGRTCLVLTQRADHIDAIVAGVAALGTDALVLRGGLGKRARQAVTERDRRP